MAAMSEWDSIELAPVMLIKSAEPVFGDRALDTLKARLRAENPEITIVTIGAASYRARELDLYTSPSLFGEPRAVVISNLEMLNEQLQKELLEYLTCPEPDVTLILRHNGGERGKKVLTECVRAKIPTIAIAQVKRAADKAAAVNADVRAAGRKMTREAVDALVDALGSDLRELLVGTRQLLADVEGTIDDSDVHRYFSGRIEATGFNVADAAIMGNTSKAIELARHAYATGVSPTVIIAAMASSVRQLTHVLGLRSAGESIIGARVKISMPGWKADRAKRALRYWSAQGLACAIQSLATADEEVKGASRDPMYAVEKAIIAVARARKM